MLSLKSSISTPVRCAGVLTRTALCDMRQLCTQYRLTAVCVYCVGDGAYEAQSVIAVLYRRQRPTVTASQSLYSRQ